MGDRKFLFIGIIIIVVAFVFLIVHGGNNNANTNDGSTTGSTPASASVVQKVTSIPSSIFDSIGVGTADNKPNKVSAPTLTANNKPEIFYEGAEYCPYCATERWAMVAALSRFGTFKDLGQTHSSGSDVYPNTQTLSFYGSIYTSQYITFVPVETYTNIPSSTFYTTLQTPTTAETNLVNKYDASPYVSQAGSIPFIDFGGSYLIAGATYSPTVLQGLSASQIAADMNDPLSPVAKGADGAANTMTAAICKLTNNQPSNVCDSAIQQIEKSL